MSKCEFFKCSFLEINENLDRILCAGIMSIYCKGTEMEDCERRKYLKKYDKLPPDNLRPDGKPFFLY